MRRLIAAAAALGTGLLIAAALPPWGWWPLALPGVAALDRLIADQAAGRRFRRGTLVGLGLYVPSLAWMLDMTMPGYVIAVTAYAALLGATAAIVPASAPGRWLALPGAVAVTELLRWSWPFGGVPLSSLAVGQVAGPLAPVLRLGGPLLLVEVTVIVGVMLSAAIARRWRAAGAAGLVVALAVGVSLAAPDGEQVGTLDVALVQGGGPQGTRASETDERVVFGRHLEASDEITTPVDLVVWPEDVVDVEGAVGETPQGRQLQQLARRLDTTLVAGVVEGVDDAHFANASVAYGADGEVVDRYDKVHRVPFGEYVPLRTLLEPFGGEDLTARDAIVGDHPATLRTPAGHLAVAISWEIFFSDRVREGAGDGAEVVLNPTNGSSFTGTLVQTQQVASSRMRAIETGRWVLQVAPTGFSAIIGPDGTVHQRSAVSERAVLQDTVGRREGTTPYTRLGLLPAVAVALLSLALGWLLAGRSGRATAGAATATGAEPAGEAGGTTEAPTVATVAAARNGPGRPVEPGGSDVDDQRDRPVVHQLEPHLGPEPTGGDPGP